MTVPRGRRTVLAGCVVALADCSLLPEEPEPIEAEATAPAVLPESAGYATAVSEEPTVETTVRVDLSGDVQLTSRRDSPRPSSGGSTRRPAVAGSGS